MMSVAVGLVLKVQEAVGSSVTSFGEIFTSFGEIFTTLAIFY